MKIKFPRNFANNNCIPEVLEQTEILFKSEGKLLPAMLYDCSGVKKLSIMGVLIFYKVIDYASANRCFYDTKISGNTSFLESTWNHYGFFEIIKTYIESSPTGMSYEFIKFQTDGTFIMAPQPLLRKKHSEVNSALQTEFTPKLNSFYNTDPKVVDMIFSCISEIIGNFWEHSLDENNSLLVAEGNKRYIEISCADTGKGIISTMRQNSRTKGLSPEKVLAQALSKGITSKPNSSHMGYGLWIIDQIVTRMNGKLCIYTEGVSYTNISGKVKIMRCGYWRGTIIYIYLPLANPVSASQIIEEQLVMKEDDLLINFG